MSEAMAKASIMQMNSPRKTFHLRKHGIDAHSTSWSRLCESGALISSFGQLSPGRCAQIERFLESMVGNRNRLEDAGGEAADAKEEAGDTVRDTGADGRSTRARELGA